MVETTLWTNQSLITGLLNSSKKRRKKQANYYLASSRELTRLNSITKAPVIHHFSENISGVMTIHSWKIQNMFSKENVKRVNANLRMDFHNSGSNECFGFRMEMLGSLVFCISTVFMFLFSSSIIKPENVGLTLSY
ncbi:ABC transporter C family member 14-like [Prunus avium]|uniref:ABC transporter C family member 14-like n=1 Tax=Prunus avium TaxID=42229 RepID=A0A6P5T000_PRUAV|nr:ABC transporter C family member 14-like [Prunus avium]